MAGVTTPHIHANILAWTGWEEAAAVIEAALDGHADRISVVYSVPDDGPAVPEHWHRVDYECFFGCKFAYALDIHDDGVLLQIQADASSEDWPGLIARVRDVFTRHPDTGMWGPDIDYSAWSLEKSWVQDFDATDSLYSVRRTDGIVWALSQQVVERLREADYSANRLGWGIEGMAIGYCYSHGLLVLKDMSIHIDHPKGTGYGANEALAQSEAFSKQLTYHERLALKLIRKKNQLPTTKDLFYMLVRRLTGKDTR